MDYLLIYRGWNMSDNGNKILGKDSEIKFDKNINMKDNLIKIKNKEKE